MIEQGIMVGFGHDARAGRSAVLSRGAARKEASVEKQAQNIQEAFLNNARKDKTFLTIYLMSGVKLSGTDQELRQILRHSGNQQSGAVDFQARDLHRGGVAAVPYGCRHARPPRGRMPLPERPGEPDN